jgi:hypothetical protein
MDCVVDDPTSAAAQDKRTEHGILAFLLGEHPAQLTFAEVERVFNASRQKRPDDAIERAVRELVGAGLFHRHGDFVIPTQAALYFAWLWELP